MKIITVADLICGAAGVVNKIIPYGTYRTILPGMACEPRGSLGPKRLNIFE